MTNNASSCEHCFLPARASGHPGRAGLDTTNLTGSIRSRCTLLPWNHPGTKSWVWGRAESTQGAKLMNPLGFSMLYLGTHWVSFISYFQFLSPTAATTYITNAVSTNFFSTLITFSFPCHLFCIQLSYCPPWQKYVYFQIQSRSGTFSIKALLEVQLTVCIYSFKQIYSSSSLIFKKHFKIFFGGKLCL